MHTYRIATPVVVGRRVLFLQIKTNIFYKAFKSLKVKLVITFKKKEQRTKRPPLSIFGHREHKAITKCVFNSTIPVVNNFKFKIIKIEVFNEAGSEQNAFWSSTLITFCPSFAGYARLNPAFNITIVKDAFGELSLR